MVTPKSVPGKGSRVATNGSDHEASSLVTCVRGVDSASLAEGEGLLGK